MNPRWQSSIAQTRLPVGLRVYPCRLTPDCLPSIPHCLLVLRILVQLGLLVAGGLQAFLSPLQRAVATAEKAMAEEAEVPHLKLPSQGPFFWCSRGRGLFL